MSVTLVDPRWFALLLLALPLGWVMLRWCVAMARARRWSAVVLRVCLLAIIAALLAGASTIRETSKVAVVGVIDISDSIRRYGYVGLDEEGQRQSVLDAAERFFRRVDAGRGPDDLLGLVVFGGSSVAVATPTRSPIDDRDLDLELVEGTDIAGALRIGSALIPPDATGRLVLMSDGNETTGDAARAAGELANSAYAGSLAIDVIPVDYLVKDETIVESLIVPTQAQADSVVTVRVVINTITGTSGTLSLLNGDQPIDINGDEPGQSRRLTLDAGRHAVLLDVPIGAGRIHRFRAVYEPDRATTAGVSGYAGDTHLDNNQAEAFTISPGSGSILLVDGLSNNISSVLGDRLTNSGADVRVVAPAGLPTDLLGYQPYDLVILENVPADEVGEQAQQMLAAHVRDMGGGLIMVGGPASFGAGGWAGTAVEPILPVELDLSEKLVERRTAIVLVLDASGSMSAAVGGSFQSQQEIANSAAAIAAKSLGAADLVGVIEFSNRGDWVRELGPNNDPEGTTSAIESIAPGGGTNLPPALAMAREALVNTEAAVKHIIVLSDGQSQGAAQLPEMCAELATQDINVSTISVGDFADTETMFAMAERGGGVHYPVTNPSVLPRIFVRAVRIVRDPLIKEGEFTPVVLPSASAAIAGIDGMRPLEGLVLTEFRDDPRVTNVLATPEGEPVLAHWTAGLGRVAAFTSDAHNKWAGPWLSWSGYDTFWSQLTQLVSRPTTGRGVELTTQIESGRMRIGMLAVDAEGSPIDGLTVPSTVYGPSGEREDVMLEQIGPGEYEAFVDASGSGNYIAVVKPRSNVKPLPPVLGGATQSNSAEYRVLSANGPLLRQIADSSGGRVLELSNPDASLIFDRRSITPRRAESPLVRQLLILAIVVMLLDIATRRIAWDRFLNERTPKTASAAVASFPDSISQLRKAAKEEPAREATHLTDEDAAKLAMEAKRKRLAERQRQASRQNAPKVQVDETESKPAEKPKQEDSGLLAAKRRARERFDES
ncbi:MAG: VWA domain-containing protein [Phycisphaerales bacterium JB061]